MNTMVSESTQELHESKPSGLVESEFVVYRRRWLVLFLYILFCICNAIQWIQYAIIADVISKYYDVDSTAVNWTSLIWMIIYIVLIFPATWLLNNKGIRFVLLVGQVLNCVGAWIKVVSVSPDLFWVTFIGQTVVSSAQVYVLGTPAAVAATWFGPSEVSTACAIGVAGFMIGNALGSLIPPLMVVDGTKEEIGSSLSVMFYSVAGFSTILLVLLFLFLQDTPPTPPSSAQATRRGRAGVDLGGETPRDFINSNLRVLKNPSFVLLVLAYGISVAVFSAIMTFLNQMILAHYPDGRVFAGNIGVAFIVSGLLGSIVCGYLLDRTRKYKEMCYSLYSLGCVFTVVLTLLLNYTSPHVWMYLAAAAIGFFMIGYLPAGYELGVELTYPEAEATAGGVLSMSTQVFAFTFTLMYGAIFDTWGDVASNGVMCVALVFGTVFSIFTKPDYRRQKADVISEPKLPDHNIVSHM